jgi:hypothetical protein
VPEFTNIFDTLCTKLGIKYSKRNIMLKYRGGLHRYIQFEMEFLDISSLGVAYRYAVKSSRRLNKRHDNFGLGTPQKKSKESEAPTHIKKEIENMETLRTTSLSHNKKRTPKE